MESVETIIENLSQFNGTFEYHPYRFLNLKPDYLLTDGVNYLINSCDCHWLVDYLLSVQSLPAVASASFQSWKLSLIENKWVIGATDGNNNRIYSGIIDSSDFPLNGITIWIIDGVILLPSEY